MITCSFQTLIWTTQNFFDPSAIIILSLYDNSYSLYSLLLQINNFNNKLIGSKLDSLVKLSDTSVHLVERCFFNLIMVVHGIMYKMQVLVLVNL